MVVAVLGVFGPHLDGEDSELQGDAQVVLSAAGLARVGLARVVEDGARGFDVDHKVAQLVGELLEDFALALSDRDKIGGEGEPILGEHVVGRDAHGLF